MKSPGKQKVYKEDLHPIEKQQIDNSIKIYDQLYESEDSISKGI